MTILPDVTHGTNAGYLRGCKCLPCCDAHAAYQRIRRAGDGPRKVDATPAREHIAALVADGYSHRAVAFASGRPDISIRAIARGDWLTIGAELEADILAVCAPPRERNVYVPRADLDRIFAAAQKAGVSRWRLTRAAGWKGMSNLGERSVQLKTLTRFEEAARSLGVTIPDGTLVALDADALRAAPVRPVTEADKRALSRILAGQERVRLHVAQRIAAECGRELAEVAS